MKKVHIPQLSPQNTEKNKKGLLNGGIKLKQAQIVKGKEVRCPVCGRKHGEVSEETVIKNFIIRCRGRKSGEAHCFIVNYGGVIENE